MVEYVAVNVGNSEEEEEDNGVGNSEQASVAGVTGVAGVQAGGQAGVVGVAGAQAGVAGVGDGQAASFEEDGYSSNSEYMHTPRSSGDDESDVDCFPMFNDKNLFGHVQLELGMEFAYEVQCRQTKVGVSLTNHTCTCQKWQLTGMPCEHAMSAISFVNDNPEDYVHHWLTMDAFNATYSHAINPVSSAQFWVTTNNNPKPIPPKLKRPTGRPKKHMRNDVQSESAPSTMKLHRSFRHTCPKCNEQGHYAKTCKGPIVQKKKKRKYVLQQDIQHDDILQTQESHAETAPETATETVAETAPEIAPIGTQTAAVPVPETAPKIAQIGSQTASVGAPEIAQIGSQTAPRRQQKSTKN